MKVDAVKVRFLDKETQNIPTTFFYVTKKMDGVPLHEQMIMSKIEEESGDVVPIGWQHFYNVLLMLLGGLATMLEMATFWIQSLDLVEFLEQKETKCVSRHNNQIIL